MSTTQYVLFVTAFALLGSVINEIPGCRGIGYYIVGFLVGATSQARYGTPTSSYWRKAR